MNDLGKQRVVQATVDVFGTIQKQGDNWKVDVVYSSSNPSLFQNESFTVKYIEELKANIQRRASQLIQVPFTLKYADDFAAAMNQIPEKPPEARKAVPARREAQPQAGRPVQVRLEPPEPVLARPPARTGKQSGAVTLFLSKQQADFEKFKQEIGFENGSVERRPSRPLAADLTQKRNNIVMELYNQLLQREDFKLFVAGLEGHPELSTSFKLDGQFTPKLELGLRVMQTFLSSHDPAVTFRNFGQFDLQTAEALRKYLVK